MRIHFTALIFLASLNCYAQKANNQVKVFKITTYLPNGTTSAKLDTITEINVKTDLTYIAKHYNYPKQWLPDSLKNPIYKSQKVVVDLGGPINSQYHSTKYTVYDSLSRVTVFGNTPCMVCNFLGSEYKVSYNVSGNIEKIAQVMFMTGNIYAILYYPSGNVKQLDRFISGNLVQRIESF